MPFLRFTIKLLVLLSFVTTSCASVPCDLDALYQKSAHCENEICPPAPPMEGPGSAKSPHASVRRFAISDGPSDPLLTVVYEPDSPKPTKAPVVLFLHGYFDADPKPYDLMLRHIARKGFIVIYPSYGNPIRPQEWAQHAGNAMNRALQVLEAGEYVQPDRTKVAFIGHSIGGILALHLAQTNSTLTTMPQPRLIITLDAAGISSLAYPFISIDNLSRIPSSTWLLLVMAEESYQYRLKDAQHCQSDKQPPGENCNAFAVNRMAYLKTPQIPSSQKAALLIPSDQQANHTLRSEHNAVQGDCGSFAKPIDAVDTWGYWKLTVGALSHVLLGDSKEYAFADTEARRALGTWSNGRKARPIVALDRCLQKGICPP